MTFAASSEQGKRPAGAGFAGIAFALLGAGSLVAYSALWLAPLWLGKFDPFEVQAQGMVALLGPGWDAFTEFAAAFLIPTAFYVAALLILPRVQPRLAWVVAIGVAILAPLILLYTYPGLAADIFDYLMIGRLRAEYGLNPYTATANNVAYDHYYLPVGWKDLPSVYGPVWATIVGAVVRVCGDNAIAALLMAKGVVIAAHWTVAALVYLTARKLDPKRGLFAFVAYAWNPLVLVHFGVDGHNDSLVLVFMMAATYFGLRGRWELSLPAMTLAALVKFVPALFIPFLVWKARNDRALLVYGLAASLFLAAITFAPFWAGDHTFDGVRDQASRLTSSPASVASFYMPDAWLRPGALALFGAGYFLVLKRDMEVVTGAYALVLLYLLVLSFWTKPWYFTWPVAFGAVLGGWAFWITVPGMLGAFASNLVGGWGWEMVWFNWQERWGQKAMESWLTLATAGGWLLGLALWAVHPRRGLPRPRAFPARALPPDARV